MVDVCFSDEAAEFRKRCAGGVKRTVGRTEDSYCQKWRKLLFPADTIVVAAMNPCPCGQFPDYNRCRCSEQEIRNYLGRISGPLLDRIDLA